MIERMIADDMSFPAHALDEGGISGRPLADDEEGGPYFKRASVSSTCGVYLGSGTSSNVSATFRYRRGPQTTKEPG